MLSGGSVHKVLEKVDLTRDGKISKHELKIGIQELGFPSVEDSTVLAVFEQLDINKDGSITMDELQSFVSNNSSSESINDPSHFAYPVFESLRRLMAI